LTYLYDAKTETIALKHQLSSKSARMKNGQAIAVPAANNKNLA
jgi:hypothetical protein